MVDYYKGLLWIKVIWELLIIPPLVSVVDNDFLLASSVEFEVKEAVSTLDVNSAPSPDGFSRIFQ